MDTKNKIVLQKRLSFYTKAIASLKAELSELCKISTNNTLCRQSWDMYHCALCIRNYKTRAQNLALALELGWNTNFKKNEIQIPNEKVQQKKENNKQQQKKWHILYLIHFGYIIYTLSFVVFIFMFDYSWCVFLIDVFDLIS